MANKQKPNWHLSFEINRANIARNEIGGLKFHLTGANQIEQADKAYDLIRRVEGLLEALRDEIPMVDEGA
jgi:hypothetical protein